MSMKKSAVLLACVGACALAVASPSSLASPILASQPAASPALTARAATASSLPVGDADTALTSKNGESARAEPVRAGSEQDPNLVTGIVVRLEAGADREATLASVNEAVTAAFPEASLQVEREYHHALQGVALKAPAGSLDAIRAVPGVAAAFIERETRVRDTVGADAAGGVRTSRIASQDPDNLSSQVMMRTDRVAQKGEGTVIAIIDTGVDMTHPAFSGALSGTPALDADKVAALLPQLGDGKDGTYVSEKFPFAYDYADRDADASPSPDESGTHGTHVAGIAAGNADKIMGTAPDAQVIVAKVSRSQSGEYPDSALLAALDDMVVLRPDVVNLSLGQTGGMDSEADSVYASVYKNLRDAGVSVNAAAGNEYSAGYGNLSGKNEPYASDPDTSVLCEPASYPSVVAVASVENGTSYSAFSAAGRDVAYQSARGFEGESVASLGDLAPGDYEYVEAGFGSAEDAAALAATYPEGLADKIVMVSRGTLDFQEKFDNIAPLKPAAILVYDNEPGDALLIMNLSTLDVPAAFISQASAQAMVEAADHHLTLVEGKVLEPTSSYWMNDFSSWGVSPDLRLKPEIAAPGGNILSSVPGGDYEHSSGTSMATPQMSGIDAIVLQRVQSDPLFASMSAHEKVDVVQNLIMGTARPLTDPEQSTGAYYSPRKQGAGLVNAHAATTSSVYPTVKGAPEPSRPKADLGDGTDGWHFDVVLHNLSDAPATYELGSQALSEIVDGGFFTEHSSDWRGRGVDIRFSGAASSAGEGASVTVPAGGEATVGVDVTPGAEFAQYVADNAPSGTFLDGFVRFASRTEGQPDLAVPFLGFYGDWGKAPIFDALASDGGAHTRASAIINGKTGDLLGYNPLVKAADRVGAPNAQRYVISRAEASGAPTVLEPRTGTLRSVHALTSTYTNEAGEAVASVTNYRNWKSIYLTSTEENTWVEAYHDPTALDATADAFKDLPDGQYTLTIAARNDGPSPTEQSISYMFRLDTAAPVISELVYSGKDEGFVVTFDVTDDSPLAAVDLHDPADGLWFYRHVFTEDEGSVGADGRYAYHVEIPMSVIQQAWTDQGGTGDVIANPYILAWDYGLNPSEVFPINLPSGNPGTPSPCVSPVGGHWAKDATGWWYVCANETGYLAGGWFTIDGADYQFGPSGYMMTGFLKRPSGEWVYADATGALASGWVRDGVYGGPYWYYLDPATNVMRTGWLFDRGSWYYLGSSGNMHTGWVAVGGAWYYLDLTGAMRTGWLKQGDAWYYLGPDGVMLTDVQIISGRTYVFGPSGALIG